MLLETPEAKEFAVGFSLADVEGGVRGYWEQCPVTSCLRAGSLSLLLAALPRAPSPAALPISEQLSWLFLPVYRESPQPVFAPPFLQRCLEHASLPLLTVRKPKTPALGRRVFSGAALGVPAA